MTGILKFTGNQLLNRLIKFFFTIIGKRNSKNRNYNAASFKETQTFTIRTMPKPVTSLLGLLRGLTMISGSLPLTTYTLLHN